MWDYDRFGSNEFLGEVLIDLANVGCNQFEDEPLWHLLSLHENAGGDLTTVPPICPTPGLMVRPKAESLLEEVAAKSTPVTKRSAPVKALDRLSFKVLNV